MSDPRATRSFRSAREAAVRSLLAATEELERTLTSGQDDLLEAALESRGRAFAALRGSADAPLSGSARALLERILELDRGLLERAGSKLAEIRTDLAGSRRTRGALRFFDADPKSPRFFSERA